MQLVKPNRQYHHAFIQLIHDYENHHETFYYNMYKDAEENFDAYVQNLERIEQNVDVPENWVSGQTFWLLIDTGEIVGNIRIRDTLKGQFLIEAGGHIGYDISPSYRNQHYGEVILKLGLIKAKERGLKQVMIGVEMSNIPSQKIVEKNGGIRHSLYTFIEPETTYIRYWLDL